MKKRGGWKLWLLIAVGVVALAVARDMARIFFPTKEDIQQASRGPNAPKFKEGDLAPEFTLPDRTGKQRAFSELVKSDTLLFFTCGCSNCQEVETYVGILRKKMGAKAPQVINVTTAKPEGEESWIERTALPQTILYEEKGGPVMKLYEGHPCPRVYRIRPDRTVAWIGPSPEMGASIQIVGVAVARNLGFDAMPLDPGLETGEEFAPPGDKFPKPTGAAPAGPKPNGKGADQPQLAHPAS